MSFVKKISQLTLFSALRDDEQMMAHIAGIVSEQNFPAGTYIIKEGEAGDGMYILAKGTVILEKKTNMGDCYPVVKLTDDMNVHFGEFALLDDDYRSISVYAETDVVCYMIKRDDFTKFCENHPSAGYHIVKEIAISLAKKLRKTVDDNMILINALCKENIEND